MPAHSIYLSKLSEAERHSLENKLWERQNHKCFLCDEEIDLELHQDDLHIDHIIPIVHQGPDDPMNFALMHEVCNKKKNATNLEIARLLNRFEKLQKQARETNERGANLDDILAMVGGKVHELRLKLTGKEVQYTLSASAMPASSVPRFTTMRAARCALFRRLPDEYLHQMIAQSTQYRGSLKV